MKQIFSFFAFVFIFSGVLFAQEEAPTKTQAGHKNNNNLHKYIFFLITNLYFI